MGNGSNQIGNQRRILRMTDTLDKLDAVRHLEVPRFSDARGQLFALERARPLPFTPVRTFVIADVPQGKHRAEHVVSCDQFLWVVEGGCHAMVREGTGDSAGPERHFRLTKRGPGLYLPKGVWLDLSEFDPGSVLLCLAAAEYDARRKR